VHPRLQAGSKTVPTMTAQRFFDEICPQVVAARKDALTALGGRFAFLVQDEGSWILDFGAAAVAPLAADQRAQVDLALRFAPDVFPRLMKGTLDVAGAIQNGDIALDGDVRLLPHLSAALRPSA
jgi:hypothetical protein